MNQPASGDGNDDMERRFQAGLQDDAGPSETVRRAILEHARRMAIEHARSQFPTPPARDARRAPPAHYFWRTGSRRFRGPVGGAHAASPGGAQAKPGRGNSQSRSRFAVRAGLQPPALTTSRGAVRTSARGTARPSTRSSAAQRPACSEKKPSAAIRPAASPARREELRPAHSSPKKLQRPLRRRPTTRHRRTAQLRRAPTRRPPRLHCAIWLPRRFHRTSAESPCAAPLPPAI